MITQKEFYDKVAGKHVHRQNYFAKILRFLMLRRIPGIKKCRNVGHFAFVTICRASSFDMVKASYSTFLKNSAIHPEQFIVVSDGSWEPEAVVKYFKRFNISVESYDWSICSNYYKQSCPSLSIWAEKHIWGKKMAAILYISEMIPVLFSDPDVLWYNTPFTKKELENMVFKTTIDNCHSYDQNAINSLQFNYLNDETPINCGVVYLNGGIKTLTSEAIHCIEYEADSPGNFAEQTVFALMNNKYRNLWKINEITSEITDLLTPLYKKTIRYDGMVARHYLWRLKWIYWKDFFKEVFSF